MVIYQIMGWFCFLILFFIFLYFSGEDCYELGTVLDKSIKVIEGVSIYYFHITYVTENNEKKSKMIEVTEEAFYSFNINDKILV